MEEILEVGFFYHLLHFRLCHQEEVLELGFFLLRSTLFLTFPFM